MEKQTFNPQKPSPQAPRPSQPPQTKISFKPITQGLGFHPFSDGLPYAPVSRAPQVQPRPQATPHTPPPRESQPTQGTGATSAGQPRFAYPGPEMGTPAAKTPVPRVSVPVATPVAQPARARGPQVQKQAQVRTARAKAPSAAPAFGEPTFGYVYLLKRMLAYGIDTILNVSLLATGLSFALLNEDLSPELLVNPGIAVISVLFFVLFSWALVTAQEIAFGTSVGKRIFGLKLEGGTSAIFLRAFFFLPSVGFCGVGLLWSLFDRQKRCWHDVVVNVQPAEVAKL